MDTSWVFFTLKNTGEGGLFSMGLNSQTEGGQILGCQGHDFTNTIILVSAGEDVSSKSQSPFLGVGLNRSLLKFGLLILGLHSNPVGVVPQLVLL